jgi:hypothetical protein
MPMAKKKPLFNQRIDGCWVCQNPYVEEHHIIYGSGRRKISDDEGCVVYLCHYHHQDPRAGIHFDQDFDNAMKQMCQRKWEEREGIDDPEHKAFIDRFYESFILD